MGSSSRIFFHQRLNLQNVGKEYNNSCFYFQCLDLGPSLMDEVLKAIDSRPAPETLVLEEDVTKSEDEGSSLTDKSPLIERQAPNFARQDSAFDNFAMSADDVSVSRDNDTDSTEDDVSDDMPARGSKESTPESRFSDFSHSGSSDKKQSKLKLVS